MSSASSDCAADDPAPWLSISGEILPDLAPLVVERAPASRSAVASTSAGSSPDNADSGTALGPAWGATSGDFAGAVPGSLDGFSGGGDFDASAGIPAFSWVAVSAASAG
jgi:hypothetical protein